MAHSDNSYATKLFWINKRIFDISISLLLLPLLFLIGIIIFGILFIRTEGKKNKIKV